MRSRSTWVLVIYALLLGSLAWFGTLYTFQAKPPLAGHGGLLLLGAVLLVWGVFIYVCLIILGRSLHWLRLIFFILLAVGLVVFGIYALSENSALADHGLQTEGVAVGRVHHIIHQSVDFIPVGTRDEYTLDYTYEIGGRTYSFHDIQVTKETWDKAATNQALPIRYLPEDPAMHQIDIPDELGGKSFIPWISFGGAFFAFLAGINGWNRRPRATPVKTATAWKNRGLPRPRL